MNTIEKRQEDEHSHEGIARFRASMHELEADARSAIASLRGPTKNPHRILTAREATKTLERLVDAACEYRTRYSNMMNTYLRSQAELSCLKEELGGHGDVRQAAESFVVYEQDSDYKISKTNRINMYPSGKMINGEPCVSFKSAAILASYIRRYNAEIKMIDGVQSIIFPTNEYCA